MGKTIDLSDLVSETRPLLGHFLKKSVFGPLEMSNTRILMLQRKLKHQDTGVTKKIETPGHQHSFDTDVPLLLSILGRRL